jgi:hypothetical protein
MQRFTTSKPRHFTCFRSAAEEAAYAHARAEDEWSNEGGHMHAKSGYIVQTRGADQPYKVVFDHDNGPDTEQACATIREGEAIIRRNTPTPPSRDTSRDQEACAL